MAIYSLLVKDVREHRSTALVLGGACLLVVLLLLAQNSVSAYSMSAFEIVRFSLIGFLPLIALIVGNRLIVNEYLSGTRLFVEALPIGNVIPLILKYCLGFGYIALIATAMVLMAAQKAGIADDVTPDYLLLILAKTWVMVSLYWSMVFCFSLCGYLRVALYLITAAVVGVLVYYPGLDTSAFAPMALMDKQLFVYERDTIPWQQLGITLVLSLVFTIAGFILTRLGEGSVIERLAKPMTRRDYVALGVLAAAGLTLASTLVDENEREPIDFSSSNVVRLNDPDVSVMYLSEQHQQSAETLAERISQSLAQLQSTLALPMLPTVRLVLSPSREKYDLDYSTSDGVFIASNWLEHDSYDDAILDTVIMHGVLTAQTNGRSVFEPHHWILDGFTRWWTEQGAQELDPQHRDELLARALYTLARDAEAFELVSRWQLIADNFAYPSAEALAWAAFNYLEQTRGRDAVIRLATEFLTQPVGSSTLGSIQDSVSGFAARAEPILGESMQEFHEGWLQWLQQQKSTPGVQRLLNSVPAITGQLSPITNPETGVKSIDVVYQANNQFTGSASEPDSLEGMCVMKHDYIGPFDMEYEVPDDFEDVALCELDVVVHSVGSTYTSGDRVFVALEYEGSLFHQPVRLHAQRLYVP